MATGDGTGGDRAWAEPGPSGAPAQPAHPVRSRPAVARARWRWLPIVNVCLVAVATAGGAVAGISAGVSGGTPGAAGAGTPSRIVLDAALHSEQQATADVSLSMTATENVAGTAAAGAGSTVLMVGSGTGQIDFADNASSLSASLHYGPDTGANSLVLDELSVGGQLYESFHSSDQNGPTLPLGKEWLEGPSPGSGQSTLGFSSTDPTAILSALSAQGDTVVPIGERTVDGSTAQGYAVTVDMAAARQRLASLGLPASMQKIEQTLLDGSPWKLDVWVNGDNELARVTVTVPLAVETHHATVTVEMDFSDYGTPVSITAPDPSQVLSWQQYLSTLRTASPTSGGAVTAG